jgi:hypothetical protein
VILTKKAEGKFVANRFAGAAYSGVQYLFDSHGVRH